MTTKPKANRFRIRRNAPLPAGSVEMPEAEEEEPQTHAISSEPAAIEQEIDAIRAENLTPRQLRMARRSAQKHGLKAASDFDAVRLLRSIGVDPFDRTQVLEVVVPQKGTADPVDQAPAGGSVAPITASVPTQRGKIQDPLLSPMQRRDAQIQKIQRDIARRRRQRLGLLITRLAFFVGLPTLLAGYYFFALATPMYSTKTEFMITSAGSGGARGGMAGLLSGTPMASATDSIATQGYLQSKDAMLRLDRDDGFRAHYRQAFIDPIQRLPDEASEEDAYRLYRKRVKIGYDPTEGIVRMEVVAADPQSAARYSERLISYAEERINHVSLEQRENQMRDALIGYEDAELKRHEAQQHLIDLQMAGATLDPEAVIVGLRAQISALEQQITNKQIELASQLSNRRPNQAKVDGIRSTLDVLGQQLTDLNARMTDMSEGENSLAQLSVRMQMAQADLATRDLMLQSALQKVESARKEATRQVRYLNNTVRPLPSETASYPRSFENTILAFLIFAGIYLMMSLTAAILKEQVTS